MLYSLSKIGVVNFATTDHDNFLSKCETLFNEVSTTEWEDYTSIEQIPEILQNHGYTYLETDQNKILTIDDYNKFVDLYFKLQQHNPTINFENGTSLVLASNRLLNYHNEAVTKWLRDTTNEVTLLNEIVGGNGFDQLDFHKSFRDTYGVSIY